MVDLPPKNHNNPPSEIEMLGEELTIKHVALIREAESFVDTVKMMPASFAEQLDADFTSDLIKKMKVSNKSFERLRKAEKEPFLRKGQYVDSFFGEIQDKLESAERIAQKPLTEFLLKSAQAEQEKRKHDAAVLHDQAADAIASEPATPSEVKFVEQIASAAQVADRVAAAPVATMAAAQGQISKAALIETWKGIVTDRGQLDLNALRPYFKDDALQYALDSFVKFGGRSLQGAKIEKIMESVVK